MHILFSFPTFTANGFNPLSTGRHVLRIQSIRSLKQNVWTVLTRQNTEINRNVARTRHECFSVASIFNCNISATSHKQPKSVTSTCEITANVKPSLLSPGQYFNPMDVSLLYVQIMLNNVQPTTDVTFR